MRIEAFILCWNESDILAMVIRHYQKFCDHITIYDNFSTDSSQLIAESMGCDVKKFGKPGVLDDQAYLDVKNNCWKSSDADYVIIADCDEIFLPSEVMCIKSLHNKNIIIDSESFDNATILTTQGWDVHSNEMPVNDITDITTGFKFDNYSKSVAFSPKHIKQINYKPGCHICEPIGEVIYSKIIFTILHVNAIGGVERRIRRYHEYMKRMSANNKRKGWGSHYWQPEAQTRREFAERLAISKPLI